MTTSLRVEAVVPKQGADDLPNLLKRIDLAYERFEGVILNDVKRTVKTWKKKSEFTVTRKTKGQSEILEVNTDDRRWHWISDGTKSYLIFPRRAKALRFRAGYTPATASNRIIARPARSFGDTVFSKGVRHPGIKPRKFKERIAKRNTKKFITFMDDALKG